MMMPPDSDKRFIYSASSVAVAAKFDGPHALNRAWATAALPMIGGTDIATEKGPNGNPVLSFASATAHVKGWESPSGVFNTLNTVTVTGLNVLKGLLTADKIEVSLQFAFTKNSKEELTVDVPPNPYTNLWIAGQDYSNVVLEGVLAKSAGKAHDKFCKDDLPKERPGKFHIHQKKRKTAFTYLSKDPNNRLQSTNTEHGYLDFDSGRVYLGEWASEEDWQGLVGLRIVFESSDPVARGEIVIADWLGNNGQFYP
jgi:hypothetical protein